MPCLECRKEIERGKYCSERCGNAYRVRMYRLKHGKEPGDSCLVPVEEKKDPILPAGVRRGLPNQVNDEVWVFRDMSWVCKNKYHT